MTDGSPAASVPTLDQATRQGPQGPRLILSLGWHFVVLIAGIILPLLAFVGFLLLQYATVERARLEAQGLEAARGIASAVERDITALTATLQTLAVSSHIAEGDLAGFHRTALEAARITGIAIVLSDRTGQQLVNTRVAFGTALPRIGFDIREVLDARRPVVLDLFQGPLVGRHLYAVAVPVFRPGTGEVTHVLNFGIDPERVRDLIIGEGIPENAVASVLDRRGRVVGRSRGHEGFVGQRATGLVERIGSQREGQLRGWQALDGTPVTTSFIRMRGAEWAVAVGVESKAVSAPLQRALWQLVGLGALAALLSTVLGVLLGRRIADALGTLKASAAALGRGDPIPRRTTAVAEVNAVGAAHVQAAGDLAERSRDLQHALEAKDALLYEVNHRVKNSLAVVTSLLTLQARQTTDLDLKRGLTEVRSRISVVASVHQRLYQSGAHDRVELGSFLGEVARDTVRALDGEGRIILDIACEPDVVLGIDKTTPLALIVSELLTNAVKYAYPGGGPGYVGLSLARAAFGNLLVTVADEGRGVPEGFDPAHSHGVGMRIVTALTRQLRGTLAVERGNPGTAFRVSFPSSE